MGKCKYEGCNYEDQARPYARKRDSIPSASTIAGLLDTGKSRSFAWAASLIAATTAVHHIEQYSGLIGEMSDRAIKNGHTECTCDKDGLCKACTYLRSEFDRRWSEKATLGSHVHHLALQWSQGDVIYIDDATEPYLDSLESFYARHEPNWIELERTVLSNIRSHGYRGQFDAIAELNCPAQDCIGRCKWLIDYKTGGYRAAEQTLQLAGYRFAQHITNWEGSKEVIDRPMPAVAHAGVLLLDPEYGGKLVELPANGDAHSVFLRLVDAYRFGKTMEQWERDNPITEIEEAA